MIRLGCLVVGLCLAGASSVAAQSRVEGRVLVVPFDGGGDPRGSWLGEGVALLLADDLLALGGDAITRDERVRAFSRLQVPPLAPLSRGTIIKVGQLVGATTVVTGQLELADESVTVKTQALHLDAGRITADIEEAGQLVDLLQIVERTARRLLPDSTVPPDELARQHAPLPAFENYVKGLLAGAPATAVGYLEKALVLEPGFHRARLALARAYARQEDWTSARTTALAVPAEAAAWRRGQFLAAFAEIELEDYDAAFERLKDLEAKRPAPEIFNNLGVIQLRRRATVHTGRPTYYFTKATEADPAQADYHFNLGYAYWREQDLQAAIYWLREAVRRNPADADAHYLMAAALTAAGSPTEAAREKELARQLSSEYEEWDQEDHGTGLDSVPAELERLRIYLQPPGASRSDTVLGATEQREQREMAAFHLDRGRRLYERENDGQSLVELRRAIFLTPYLAEAHLLVARIHLRAGRTAEAIEALKISLWSEETAAAHVTLGSAYLRLNDVDGARREATRALELAPHTEEAEGLLRQIDSAERAVERE